MTICHQVEFVVVAVVSIRYCKIMAGISCTALYVLFVICNLHSNVNCCIQYCVAKSTTWNYMPLNCRDINCM